MKKAKRKVLSFIISACLITGFVPRVNFNSNAFTGSTPIVTYIVAYNGNGNNVFSVPAPQTKTHNIPLSLTIQTPVRAGFVFLGWARSPFATEPNFRAEEIFAGRAMFEDNANTTLYAVWRRDENPHYTVVYNANGGTGAPVSHIKLRDVPVQISTQKPVRAGFEFVGWGVEACSAWSEIWGAPPSSWDANWWNIWDAAWGPPPAGWSSTWWNSWNANWLNNSAQAGWWYGGNASLGFQIPVYQPGEFYTLNAHITLIAIWRTSYAVTFNANGGEVFSASAAVNSDGKLDSLPVPTRIGHTFNGWYLTPVGGGEAITTDTVFESDTVIYAGWIFNGLENASPEFKLDEIRAAANINNGTVVSVEMFEGSTSVSTEILEIIRGRNVRLSLNFGTVGRIVIDGREINYVNSSEDLNLLLQYSMSMNAVFTPEYHIPPFMFETSVTPVHRIKIGEREMGIKGSSLTVYPGAHYAGMKALLCIYSAATGKFELISSGIINLDGSADLPFDRTGDFALVIRHIGDVMGTGTVTANDALEILKATAGRITLDLLQIHAATARSDGKLSAADALNILKFVTGRINAIRLPA